MKTQPQSDPDMRHLAKKLEDHRVTMLTLHEPGAGLSSRPMTPLEMDRDGAIWMIASRETLPLGSEAAPVNLAFIGRDEGDYISVAGRAECVDDAARKKELWTAAARPWFDGPDDPKLVLLKVSPERAEIWDGPDSAVTRTLSMAASVIAGRPVNMGHKEVVEPRKG